jgi:hypothetical protein
MTLLVHLLLTVFAVAWIEPSFGAFVQPTTCFRGCSTGKDGPCSIPRVGPRLAMALQDTTTDSATADETLLEVAQAKLEILEGVVREMKVKAGTKETEWKGKQDAAQSARDEAQKVLFNLQLDWDEAKRKWDARKSQYEKERENLLEKNDMAQKNNSVELRKHKEMETRLRQKIESIKTEMDRLDSTIANMAQEAAGLTDELRRIQSQSKNALDREREKVTLLEEQVLAANQERDGSLERLNEMKRAEKASNEAIEIAEASVAAAERREVKMRTKYEDLQSDFRGAVKVADEEKASLLKDLERSAQQNTSSSSDDELRQEVLAQNDQILSLKAAHGAKLRAAQRDADERLEETKEMYQKQMQQFRKGVVGGTVELPKRRGIWQRIRRVATRER